jgi:hypothetical protein
MPLLKTTDPKRYRDVQSRVMAIMQSSPRTAAAEKARAEFRAALMSGPKLVEGSAAFVAHRERALAAFDAAIAIAKAEQ